MRKYLQITFVLGIFGVLVLLRQLKGNDLPIVVQKANIQIPTPTSVSTSNMGSKIMPTQAPMIGSYKNGTYTGSVQDAFYGNIQVQAIISGGGICMFYFLNLF